MVMSEIEKKELAKEIASLIPSKKRWYLISIAGGALMAIIGTTITTTLMLQSRYNLITSGIENNRENIKIVKDDVTNLKVDVRLNTFRMIRCCPAVSIQ